MLRPCTVMLGRQTFSFTREHSWQTAAGWWHEARSKQLVCPQCGRSWAQIILAGDRFLWPVDAFCEDCGTADEHHPVPGSLLTEIGHSVIDISLLHALPPELLQREFLLHNRQLEKESEL